MRDSNSIQANKGDTAAGSLAEQLAAYCVQAELGHFPDKVVAYAKYLLLDLVGAALAGVDTAEVRAAISAVRMMEPAGGLCNLWGTPHGATPSGAALVNGIAAHARELDDFGGVDHTGAVVVPALLAMGEASPPVSGPRFLEAMIVGYEVGRRVLDAAGGYRSYNHSDGWHSTGSCGSFAAAAAVSKALDLNVRQSTWALGLAGSFTGGTWAFAEDGAMSKRYHAGRAAETGVVAACLAQAGFTGPAHIFDADWGGFFGTYARTDPCPDRLVRNLGKDFGILRSGIKPYAACRDIHSTLDVVLAARREHQLTPGDIEKVQVQCIPEMIQMVGKTALPQTRLEAQLSLPYSVGVAMVTGRAFLAEYEQPLLSDATVKRLAGLVEVVENAELPFDSEPHVTIYATGGRIIEGHVAHAGGAPQNPLSPEAVVEKFEALASRVFLSRHVQALKRTILAIETTDDVRSVAKYLRLSPSATPA